MRVSITLECQQQANSLPIAIREKFTTFTHQLYSDSTASGLHIEKIKSFRDPKLRSARVDQDYRAIIRLDGNEAWVLYVDKHDSAYAWGERRQVTWNEHTESYQIMVLPTEAEQSELSAPPVSAAQEIAACSDEDLLNIGVPASLLPFVRAVQDLNGLDLLEKLLPQDAFAHLFSLLVGVPIGDIVAEVRAGLAAEEEEDKSRSANNRQSFIEIENDAQLQAVLMDGMAAWTVFLHPTQRAVVEADYPGPARVSGAAGTGKTVAAIHRLKRLCETPGAKVLFTTYTKALCTNLKGMAGALHIAEDRFRLANIDKELMVEAWRLGVCDKTLRVLYDSDSEQLLGEMLTGLGIERNARELLNEYLNVIAYYDCQTLEAYLGQPRVGMGARLTANQRREVWELAQRYEALKRERNCEDRLMLFNRVTHALQSKSTKPYTSVVADEYQDFSNPELRFLRALCPEGPNDLFLTGDPYQRIYPGRRINFHASGIEIRGIRSSRLKVNYRTTEEIKRLAVSILRGVPTDNLEAGEADNRGYVSLTHGAKPTYMMFSTWDEEAKYVVELLERLTGEEGVKPADICVAGPGRNLYNNTLKRLHNTGIPYCELYGASKKGDEEGVRFCAWSTMKGLEFRVVILVGVNSSTAPRETFEQVLRTTPDAVEAADVLQRKRALLYVAITRAREVVHITGCGKASELIERG